MVLESIIICVDNSEWSRNGDYHPTRMDAQSEAVEFLTTNKLNSNPETTVGLLSLAGSRIQVHVSPCQSVGSLMTALAKNVFIEGKSNLVSGLKTASLALKNRLNKNSRQRIIAFVASPITATAQELEKLGKLFKKNNVAVDVINFGAENATNDNAEKLEALISATNNSDNSHFVNIPPGPHVLSDLILNSPIVHEGAGGGLGGSVGGLGGSGGGAAGAGGIDPDVDPELAMAIRMSMEEQRQRQGPDSTAATTGVSGTGTGAVTVADTAVADSMEEDEEAQMARAIALSMAAERIEDNMAVESQTPSKPETTANTTTNTTVTATTSTSNSTTTSEASTNSSTNTASASASGSGSGSIEDIDISSAMDDPDFINSLLNSVPGSQDQQGIDSLLDELSGAGGDKNKSNSESSDKDKNKK